MLCPCLDVRFTRSTSKVCAHMSVQALHRVLEYQYAAYIRLSRSILMVLMNGNRLCPKAWCKFCILSFATLRQWQVPGCSGHCFMLNISKFLLFHPAKTVLSSSVPDIHCHQEQRGTMKLRPSVLTPAATSRRHVILCRESPEDFVKRAARNKIGISGANGYKQRRPSKDSLQ